MIIIMGVSGSGKTTIGKTLASELNLPFFDADDFHSQRNIEKMTDGIPLDDDDRLPWLQEIATHIQEWDKSGGAVLACSALKESYRAILGTHVAQVHWVCLSGTQEQINTRINHRIGHFMNKKLLHSQLQTLEIPDYGIQVDISNPPHRIIQSIKKWLANG